MDDLSLALNNSGNGGYQKKNEVAPPPLRNLTYALYKKHVHV